MKRLALFAVAVAFALSAAAQEPAAPKPTGDDLVKAAAQAKKKRKTSKSKPITNADVRKSKGKLIVLDTPKGDVAPAEKPAAPVSPDKLYQQRLDAQAALDAAEKKTDELRKELDKLEQRYYEENDPNYRDQVIRQRFTQTKRQLEKAEQALADARDARDKLDQPPPQ